MSTTKTRKRKVTESRPRTALVYLRASSKDDLGAQRAAMAQWATARNYRITDWRVESSGTTSGFQGLQEHIGRATSARCWCRASTGSAGPAPGCRPYSRSFATQAARFSRRPTRRQRGQPTDDAGHP